MNSKTHTQNSSVLRPISQSNLNTSQSSIASRDIHKPHQKPSDKPHVTNDDKSRNLRQSCDRKSSDVILSQPTYPTKNNFSPSFKVLPINLWIKPGILDPRIKTVLRIRPFLSHEIPNPNQPQFECFLECTSNAITMPTVKEQKRQEQQHHHQQQQQYTNTNSTHDVPFLNNEQNQLYRFNSIIPPWVSSAETFSPIVQPYCDVFLNHYNATLIAYGQTGSGKTFTMSGPLADNALHLTGAPLTSNSGGDNGSPSLHGEIDMKSSGIIMASVDYIYKSLIDQTGVSPTTQSNTPTGITPPATTRESYKLECSFVEIYNDKITDLLHSYHQVGRQIVNSTMNSSSSSLLTSTIQSSLDGVELFETSTGQFIPKSLEKIDVTDSMHECLNIIRYAFARRHTTATLMNRQSSRSHLVFTMYLTSTMLNTPSDGSSPYTSTHSSKLCLVDLAGSERVKQSGVSGHALKEATMINKSLSCLTKVIKTINEVSSIKINLDELNSSLASSSSSSPSSSNDKPPSHDPVPSPAQQQQQQQQQSHIPYRDNVLTKLLKDSLGGNSATCLIACISPSQRFTGETIRTLRFAENTGRISNTITTNEDEDPSQHNSRKLSGGRASKGDSNRTRLLSKQLHLLITELQESQQKNQQLMEELERYKAQHTDNASSGDRQVSQCEGEGIHQSRDHPTIQSDQQCQNTTTLTTDNQSTSSHHSDGNDTGDGANTDTSSSPQRSSSTPSSSSSSAPPRDDELITLRKLVTRLYEELKSCRAKLHESQYDLKISVRALHKETTSLAAMQEEHAHIKSELLSTRDELASLTDRHTSLESEYAQLQEELYTKTQQYTSLQQQHDELTSSHQSLQESFHSLSTRYDNTCHELKMLKITNASLHGELTASANQLKQEQQTILSLRKDITGFHEQVHRLTTQCTVLIEEKASLETTRGHLEQQINTTTTAKTSVENDLAQSNLLVAQLQQQLANALQENERLTSQLHHDNQQHTATLQEERSLSEQKLNEVMASLSTIKQDYESLSNEHSTLQSSYKLLDDRYEEMVKINKALYHTSNSTPHTGGGHAGNNNHSNNNGHRKGGSSTHMMTGASSLGHQTRRGDRFDLCLATPMPIPVPNKESRGDHYRESRELRDASSAPPSSSASSASSYHSTTHHQYDTLQARMMYLETINEERKAYRDRCKRLEDELDQLKLKEAVGNRRKIIYKD